MLLQEHSNHKLKATIEIIIYCNLLFATAHCILMRYWSMMYSVHNNNNNFPTEIEKMNGDECEIYSACMKLAKEL